MCHLLLQSRGVLMLLLTTRCSFAFTSATRENASSDFNALNITPRSAETVWGVLCCDLLLERRSIFLLLPSPCHRRVIAATKRTVPSVHVFFAQPSTAATCR